MKPIYIHSGMAGAPQYANANGNINAILEACLVNGFNTKTATSASASGGILTLNFAADPGFEALQTVEVAVSSTTIVNGTHRVIANVSNQVTIAIAGLADGAVGSSGVGITIKQASAGWSKPYSSSNTAVFRPPAGNRRYLRCVHAVNANLVARGYEVMTAISTGTGLFPTTAQDAAALVMQNNAYVAPSGTPWFVIATDKWMVYSMADALVPNYALEPLFFGDIAEQVKPADAYCTYITLQSGKYMARNYAGSATPISTVLDIGGVSSPAWPSVIADGLRLIPYITVHEQTGSVLRGVQPNAYKMMPNALGDSYLDIYTNVAGVSGRVKPVQLGNGGVGSLVPYAIAIDEEAWT
jgi:hypothetical protein